jgi:hypothetical protein
MSRILLAGLFLATISVCEFCGATERIQADFYVAPDGQDENPGTYEAPFRTLTGARNALRKLKSMARSWVPSR